MDPQILGAIAFVILLSLLLHLKKRRITFMGRFPFAYIALYRTKLGLNFMDRFAKRFSKMLRALSYLYIISGFLLMVLFSGSLIWSLLQLFIVPEAPPSVGIVLPIPLKGAFYVPFFYWIISVFLLAIIHEGSHGVISRVYNIKLKSSGFAFLGIILPIVPAAFVEPCEKEVAKRPLKQRLALFSSGSIANIIVGLLVLLILIIATTQIANTFIDFKGVNITEFTEPNLAAQKAGMLQGQIITAIDENKVSTLKDLEECLNQKKPGDTISVKVNESVYNVVLGENPKDPKKPYLGVYVEQVSELKKDLEKYKTFLNILFWFLGLLYWIYLLNIGIGLFNLLPVLPLDGGRMLKDTLEHFIKKERAEVIIKAVNLLFISTIVINLVATFVK